MDTFVKQNTPIQASSKDLVLVYAKHQFLCTHQNQVLFNLDEIRPVFHSKHPLLISLGLWNDTPVYLMVIDKQPPPTRENRWQSLRPLMQQIDLITFKMLGYAAQLANWAIDYKFCGRCATKMQPDFHQHNMLCPNCGNINYPRLNPSMIVLVTRGDEVLLARSPRFTTNMYSTLAGFVEPGESVEECVHREVQEEVGVLINNLRYVTSQNWPYPQSLMLGFHADYSEGDIIVQPEEIEDARWFSIRQLPELAPKQAISRYLIDLYVAEKLATAKPTFPN